MAIRTAAEIRRYDLMKLTVTLILIAIIAVLLWQGRAAPSPEPTSPAASAPTNTAEPLAMASATEAATATPAPTEIATAVPPTATPSPTPVTLPAPTLTFSDREGATAVLHGVGAPGSRVQIVANGEVITDVTVAEDGAWMSALDLAPGDYELQARAVNEAGEVVAASEVVAFTQPDTTLSAPTILTPTAGSTLVAGRDIHGVGAPGEEIEVLRDGEVIGRATVREDGAWSLLYNEVVDEIDGDLAAGPATLSVQYRGDSESASTPLDVSIAAPADQEGSEDTVEEQAEDLVASTPATVQCGSDEPPLGEDRGDSYVVAPCEYMALIAQRTGVSLAALIAANPQVEDPARIYPGQVLHLPPR